MKSLRFTLWALLLAPSLCFGWGQRGHQAITIAAARLIQNKNADSEKEPAQSFGRLFGSNDLLLAHTSSLPDISWKTYDAEALTKKLNPTSHYLDVERLLGNPSAVKDFEKYRQEIRKLPTSYSNLLETWEGKISPLDKSKVNIYENGSAPWRLGQLYSLAVDAWKCFSHKSRKNLTREDLVFEIPIYRKHWDEVTESPYRCNSHASRFSDIEAALAFSGLMAHFIEDLSQPFHTTVDSDGWSTGNGGIHSYFEEGIVESIGDTLTQKIIEKASNSKISLPAFRERPKYSAAHAVQLALDLTAESFGKLNELRKLDDQFAIEKKSKVFPLGEAFNDGVVAVRKNPKEVSKKFESLIVDQMAIAAGILASLWESAWNEADSPEISLQAPDSQKTIYLKYPLDLPFVFPTYDEAAILNAKAEVKKKQ